MPIQLAMPSVYSQERFSTIPEEDEDEECVYVSAEEKSGDLVMICPDNRKQRIQLKVYRTTLEHFAVVYPQKKICKPLGVLNLRNTTCQRLTGGAHSGIVVKQNGFDCPASVTFLCGSPRDVPSWTSALSAPVSFIRQSSLPIVEEDEEF